MADPPRIPLWIETPPLRASRFPWPAGGRAFVHITFAHDGRSWSGEFLIDTGASASVLGVAGAIQLLRDDYFLIDFDRDPQRVDVGGIGGRVRCVPRQFDLWSGACQPRSRSATCPAASISRLRRAGVSGLPH